VWVSSHGGFYGLEEKYARLQARGPDDPNPFYDPEGYQAHVEESEATVAAALARPLQGAGRRPPAPRGCWVAWRLRSLFSHKPGCRVKGHRSSAISRRRTCAYQYSRVAWTSPGISCSCPVRRSRAHCSARQALLA